LIDQKGLPVNNDSLRYHISVAEVQWVFHIKMNSDETET